MTPVGTCFVIVTYGTVKLLFARARWNCRCGEMADAQDLKSWGLKKPCGFESHHRHQRGKSEIRNPKAEGRVQSLKSKVPEGDGKGWRELLALTIQLEKSLA